MPPVSPYSDVSPVIIGLIFIVGLCMGSFLNVVAHRFLTNQSITRPPSHCPSCKTPLRWFQNIPIFSYLFQRGRCLTCYAAIGLEYPLSELMTGLLFVAVLWKTGLTLQGLFLLFLVANLVVITLTDIKESLIFQVNSLSLVPIGLLYSWLDLSQVSTTLYNWGGLQVPESFISAMIAVLLAFVLFEGLIILSRKLLGTDGFGHGDTHLMMGVGAFLGWKMMLLALFLGFLFQSLPAIPLLVMQWIKRKDYTAMASISGGLIFGILPVWLINVASLSLRLRAILVFVCFFLTLACLFIFLRRSKEAQSFTYLPLGPALVMGSLVALFWGQAFMSHFLPQWL